MKKTDENVSKKKRIFSKNTLFVILILLILAIFLGFNNNSIEFVKEGINSISKSLQEEEKINSKSIKRVYITSSRDRVSIKDDDYAMLEVHVVNENNEDLGNVGTVSYFQSSTDGGSVQIEDEIIKGLTIGTVKLYVTIEYNGETCTSNTMEIIVQENYEIEYEQATLYKYDADTLFKYGGSVTDIEKQGIYFAGAKKVTLGGVTFTTSDWNRWTKNIDGMDETMPYTGLAENELDADGNIQFTKPDYGIFDNTPSEGKEVYTRIGLPFVKQGNGFYIFDSSKYETYFPNGQPANDVNLEWSDQKVTYEGGWQRILSF